MKLSILLSAATLTLPSLAQIRPPIQIPGLGECPDECIAIRVPTTGALQACCGTAEGCVDCGSDCTALCNGGTGPYGGCVDLGNTELTCSTGCELLCDSTDYVLCDIGGAPLEPKPAGCP